jgi:hypothetical protein
MAVVIGRVGVDEWVLELGEGDNWGSPERTVTDKRAAQTFPTYEIAAAEAFQSGILDETKWGIEER